MSYTSAEVDEFYNAAKASYLKALDMVEYTIKDRSLKRAKLEDLKAEMDKWKRLKDQLDDGVTTPKINIKRHVPLDT